MCILIVKPSGVIAPTKDILQRCFDTNPDGAGVCFEKNGNIYIRKGLMDFESFLKEVNNIPLDSTALIHCRIGTSGGNIPELTHPYPLTNKIKDLKRTKLTLTPKKNEDGTLSKVYAVGHNGVFSGLGEKGEINDTCMFIANILTPLANQVKDIIDPKLDSVISRLVDTSRIAIMDNTGKCRMYGYGWEEQDGIYYSNSGYKKPKWEGNYNYKWYGNYDSWQDRGAWSNYYDDDDDEVLDAKLGDRKKDKGYKEYYEEILKQFGTWAEYAKYSKLTEKEKIDYFCDAYPEGAEWIMEMYEDGYYTPEDIRGFLYDEYLRDYYNDEQYSLLTDDKKEDDTTTTDAK